jgi:outer membrane PBP1 activator LpoA protein
MKCAWRLTEPETIRETIPNICYFALSPEDEARDAARHHIWEQRQAAAAVAGARAVACGDRVAKRLYSGVADAGAASTVLQQRYRLRR